jgi:hypothetical protein
MKVTEEAIKEGKSWESMANKLKSTKRALGFAGKFATFLANGSEEYEKSGSVGWSLTIGGVAVGADTVVDAFGWPLAIPNAIMSLFRTSSCGSSECSSTQCATGAPNRASRSCRPCRSPGCTEITTGAVRAHHVRIVRASGGLEPCRDDTKLT